MTKTTGGGTIHLVITGGTIDSYYDGTKDTVVPSKESALPAFIQSLKLSEKIIYTTVCMNGTVFSPDEVMKVIKEGRFTSIYESKK